MLDPLDEGVFLLTLNRPDARNSIGRQFLRELMGCLEQVALERTGTCMGEQDGRAALEVGGRLLIACCPMR